MITTTFASFDGQPIAIHRAGACRPVLMLHGFFASADLNFVQPGIVQALVDAGLEVSPRNLRGHGQSAVPSDPAAWPADAGLDVPTLVVCGQDDADNGSAELLAAAMPTPRRGGSPATT
jgi:hypothetical protein